MTHDQLKMMSVRGIDKLLDNWFARRSLSSEEIRLARAQRAFWLAADSSTLSKLSTAYDAEPVGRTEDDRPPTPQETAELKAQVQSALADLLFYEQEQEKGGDQ